MRIAQVSPLMESVPPKLYGGTERIVSFLTEELIRQGHEVVLFASGDSETSAELVSCVPEALRLADVRDPLPYNILQLEQVRQRANEFDILHFHTDYLHFPIFRCARHNGGRYNVVTTMHGRMDLPAYPEVFHEFREMPLVSISNHQRRALQAYWEATVHHGLPRTLYALQQGNPAGYLAFLGRICPEKRPDRAIEIAKRAGLPLKIAAKVDPADHMYFETHIRHPLDHPLVEYVGEIDERQKQDFLGNALALLFPIDWPEPFGLAMIEAMACGTPVVAWREGSVPEVIDEGVSGFIVDSIDVAVAAIGRLPKVSRAGVRRCFEKRFSVERMAHDYIALYETLVEPEIYPRCA